MNINNEVREFMDEYYERKRAGHYDYEFLKHGIDKLAKLIDTCAALRSRILEEPFDLAATKHDLECATIQAKNDFEDYITNRLETPEARDKAVLAMMFHSLVYFDPDNETHVKGLSAILSADKVVKPNTVNYYDYLKSPQWQTVRDAALKRANHQCEKCKSGKNLEVHHITYKRLGYELPEDLIVLCKDCHENVHSKDLKQNDDFFANSSEGFPEGF